MKFLLRLIVVLMMVGSAYAQSNLTACPSSGYFHNCFGTATDARGNKYVGEFKDDKPNGQGTFTYADGNKYVGEFKDSGLNGQGTFTHATGAKYVGEFKDNKSNGQGILYLANGSISQSGIWSDNRLVTAQNVDPNRFTRIAKGNSAPSAAEAQQSNLPACPSSGYFHNCFGTFTQRKGNKYVGEFKDDKFNGQGTYTWIDGGKYVGEWKDDQRNGQGTHTFADGSKYVGEWKDDNRNGQGILYLANGSISQSGIWSDNRLVTAQSVDRDRSTQQEDVSQKKADISIDDERLLKGYGTCDSILKAQLFIFNRSGLQDNPIHGITTHQLTIYTILNLNIVRKYPESLHEKALKIMSQFAEETIKTSKSLTGSQLNAFRNQNGGCSLDEVPRAQIDKIMLTDSYDMVFKRFKK